MCELYNYDLIEHESLDPLTILENVTKPIKHQEGWFYNGARPYDTTKEKMLYLLKYHKAVFITDEGSYVLVNTFTASDLL